MGAKLNDIECVIKFPPRPEITNVLGKTFKPESIRYRAYIYEGQYYEHAIVFGAEHDNLTLPFHDHDYPAVPEWFKNLADNMRATVEEATDA